MPDILKHTPAGPITGDPGGTFPSPAVASAAAGAAAPARAASNWAQQMHGQGGMFSTPGLENPFISTIIKPQGLGALLPSFPSNAQSPLYSFITGIGEDAGWSAAMATAEICGDFPGGFISTGSITATFGRLQAGTKTIDLGSVNKVINSSERTDLMMLGNLLPQEMAGSGYASNVNESNVLNNMIISEMVASAWVLAYKNGKMLWEGDPGAAGAGKGWIPYKGLNKLVGTGYKDAIVDKALPGLDSVVIPAFGDINTKEISAELRALMGYLEDFANKTVGGATFALVMTPGMWGALSDVWAQKYVNEWTALIGGSSAAAADTTASRVILDAASLTAQRDALKTSMTLPIGGKLYPVILDNGMTETSATAAGKTTYTTSIFVLPLSIGPGMPVLYWEYMNWMDNYAMASAAGFADNLIFWTDGGRFAWTMDQVKMCIKLQCRTEPRLVLRTPQFAARLDGVTYTSLHPYRPVTVPAADPEGEETRPPAPTITDRSPA